MTLQTSDFNGFSLTSEGGLFRLRNAGHDEGFPKDFTVLVGNYLPVALAYGPDFAQDLLAHIADMLCQWTGSEGWATSPPALASGTQGGFSCAPRKSGPQSMRDFCQSLARRPIRVGGHDLHALLSFPPESATERSAIPHGPGSPAVAMGSEAWSAEYRRDMAASAAVIALLNAGEICMVWQAVCSPEEAEGVLFQMSAIRRLDVRDGTLSSLDLAPLHRTGLIGILDHWAVESVILRLEEEALPQLAVTISSGSAVPDGCWDALTERLRRRPDVAQRLTIILSDLPEDEALGRTASFASQWRNLGCRIGVAGFGANHVSLRHLLILTPHVVMLDPMLLCWAEQSGRNQAILRHTLPLAGATGSEVVITGVRSQHQFDIAVQAGAQWLHGDAVAWPRWGVKSCPAYAAAPAGLSSNGTASAPHGERA